MIEERRPFTPIIYAFNQKPTKPSPRQQGYLDLIRYLPQPSIISLGQITISQMLCNESSENRDGREDEKLVAITTWRTTAETNQIRRHGDSCLLRHFNRFNSVLQPQEQGIWHGT